MRQNWYRSLYSYILIGLCAMAVEAAGQSYQLEAQVLEDGEQQIVGASTFRECRISARNGRAHGTAQCAYLAAPLNHSDPSGEHVNIFVYRFESSGKKIQPDPLLLLAGGPGHAGSDTFLDSQAFEKILKHRDIYVLDQRGTGLSTKLHCPGLDAVSVNTHSTELAGATVDCLENMKRDPRHFTTSAAVQDIEALRKALSIPRWNIYGVSYGSRLAQQYAKQFPDSVRSLILDGVVPLSTPLESILPQTFQSALKAVLERCYHNTPCATAFPNIRESEVLFRLFQENDESTITSSELALVIRNLLQSASQAATLPLGLSRAVEGDHSLLNNQLRISTANTANTVSTGPRYSVLCTEDAPLIQWSRVDWDAIDRATLGSRDLLHLREICRVWPKGVLADGFHTPLSGSVPALLLAGDADPLTSPEKAAQVAANLTQAQLVVMPGQGHSLISIRCIQQLAAKFVESPTRVLERECLDRAELPHFFLNLSGPTLSGDTP